MPAGAAALLAGAAELAPELALELGSAKVLNIIMLGVYIGVTQVVPADVVWSTIEHKLGKKPALLPLNRQAFEMGLKLGAEQR